jgi:hypothetical protein
LAQDFVSGRVVHDAGIEGVELLAENIAEEKAALPTAPLECLPPADAPPTYLVGVTEHGVLDGRYLRHTLTKLQTSLRQSIAQAIASMKRSMPLDPGCSTALMFSGKVAFVQYISPV